MRAEDETWLTPNASTVDIDAALATWRRDGFVHLPGIISERGLRALRTRCDDLMFGRIDHSPFFFQGDAASGLYSDMPLGLGWTGPSAAYRKLEKLERDPVFFDFMCNDFFRRIATRAIPDADIVSYRAILMNKRAGSPDAPGGTDLPWHQDGGRLWGLDRDPEFQVWTAIDDAPLDAGCMVFARGTHHAGLATPLGGAVPAEIVEREKDCLDLVPVPAKAGDVVILHTMVWHTSGLNTTAHPRRAFSTCLMPATTRCVRKKKAPRTFPLVFERT
jgi:hypothetical protein